MNKLIIFDFDGVLLDAKKIHFDTLNEALNEFGAKYVISEQEHLSKYDGLKTVEKLQLLSKEKSLPTEFHEKIWRKKQEKTLIATQSLKKDERLIEVFQKLRNNGIKLACCSNSIRRSLYCMLSKLGLVEYLDLILSNEDVVNSKPHPEIYWKAMSLLNNIPEDTLIIEDSPVGLLGAKRSGANVLRVKNSSDLTYDKIMNETSYNCITVPKWQDKKLNVLIPMAGAGSRFQQKGYSFPKPLIDIRGKPMINVVVENLNVDANFIFVVRKEHREKYNLDVLLNLVAPNCKIIETDGVTEGAACTTLLAKDLINTNNPLLIANSDQYIHWNSNDFFYKMNEQNVDGAILCFESTHPRWSYIKRDSEGFVSEVKEKVVISNEATVGIYYWRSGAEYVKYAEDMIQKNIRVNGEFYVCPVFNEAINDKKKIKPFTVDKMYGLGTPEDLEFFLENYNHL